MNATPTDAARDECYRCGYDLRGIDDEQACPECGLLAQRSRRESDELHNTRPRWLRGLSRGINLILLAIATPIVWPFFFAAPARLLFFPRWWTDGLFFLGFDAMAAFLTWGVFLLTRPEGYPPADEADRARRTRLRLAAGMLLALALFLHLIYGSLDFLIIWVGSLLPIVIWVIAALVFVLFTALPLLLFLRLRGLAGRARSAHLAEHCKIVGIGTSISVVYIAAAMILFLFSANLGLDSEWAMKSTIALVLQLLIGVACGLFLLWSLYLLIRFGVAFRMASRNLRRNWLRDDRSVGEVKNSRD